MRHAYSDPTQGGDRLSSPASITSSFESIPHDEVRRLLRLAQAGDTAARDRLILANLRLVHSLVGRFISANASAERDDLFQAGCLGLMQAIERFDLRFDVRFSTYAVPLILAEIKRHLREDRSVRITRHGLELARRASEARDALQLELGRSPTPQEIGERIGASREEVVAALDAAQPVRSLDEPAGTDEDSRTRLEQLVADDGDAYEAMVEGMALRTALRELEPLERRVLIRRFIQEKRQVDVARELQVSQAYVSRLERKILKRLRELLER